MANILNIDTSTSVGSIAFAIDGKVVFERVSFEDRSHAVKTGVFVDEIMGEIENSSYRIDAVAVCSGPGSYTGLRIGISIAKGLCYGLEVPLIAVPSLKVIAKAVSSDEEDVLCPMIDARRMEVYCAVYDQDLNVLEEINAKIVDEDSFGEYLLKGKVLFFGDGSAKCKELISSTNAVFMDDIVPLASNLAPLAEEAYQKQAFEDVAYFEPFYLKDFVATVSKKKLL